MTRKSLRIVFMGTPDFSVPALASLYEAGHEIVCVYTQPPRPKGRGQKIQPSPVQLFAESKNIPVLHPVSLKSAEAQKKFADHNADVAVVAAYGLILPKNILDAPRRGCINIHASVLPRWRGASPIQRAILNGDSESGVTLMQMDEGLDTGAMIAVEKIPLNHQTTAASLHDALSVMGGRMIVRAMERLAAEGKLHSTPQPEEGIIYAHLLKKEDGRIDWTKPADETDRMVRALNPWPGTWCEINGERLKILETEPVSSQQNQPPGTVNPDGSIACGKTTALRLLKLQPAGARPMDFPAALSGHYIKAGDRLP